MKSVIQRVKSASVSINGELYSRINGGILVLLGVEKGDTTENGHKLADKILKLRIFEDEMGKMNKSVEDIKGELLIVSQFTLLGDCKKGTRPSFDKSETPNIANQLYEDFLSYIKKSGLIVNSGKFGAMMEVALVNDGPVTFIIEK